MHILKHIIFWLLALILFAAGVLGITFLVSQINDMDSSATMIVSLLFGLVWGALFGRVAFYAWLAVFE